MELRPIWCLRALPLWILGFTTSNALSRPAISSLDPLVEYEAGLKFPGPGESGRPVNAPVTFAGDLLTGYTKLIPYVLASPTQDEAGSCLYMSLTGLAEWWLARLNPKLSRTMNGPLDLSERYLMSLAGLEEDENGMDNWRTDSIYLFNQEFRALHNTSYPFTKGWYLQTEEAIFRTTQDKPDASYGTMINWVNELDQVQHPTWIPLPQFDRDIIFADPEANQWNVGVTPDDIVDQVKAALHARQAPVHVIYNHYGYWHAVNIVGYDDHGKADGCAFTVNMPDYFLKKADEFAQEASQAQSRKEQARLEQRATRFRTMAEKSAQRLDEIGGCRDEGIFYVRDSLYPDPQGPIYDYDPRQAGDESALGKVFIKRSYEWLRVVGNHVTQVHPAE